MIDTTTTAQSVKKELQTYASKQRALILQKYFKTGEGEYAHGDVFLGLTVPQVRKVARKYKNLALTEIQRLVKSKFHEERLTSLLILVDQFKNANTKQKERIFNFYLHNTKHINNWDLVDLSAPRIIGEWLTFKDRGLNTLEFLAKSQNLWERRIAIISTLALIKNDKLDKSLKIAKMLIKDKQDLIHKAVGWALRDVGKKDRNLLEKFLQANYSKLPRTSLRYAIEKFPEQLRLQYLSGKFIEV